MNKSFILDASALLALINQEPGSAIVEEHLVGAQMSAINAAEVATVLCNLQMPLEEIEEILNDLLEEIIPFDTEQALLAAALRNKTKHKGLSLGDRACLALGMKTKLPILTADKVWLELNLGLKIHTIR